MDHEFPERLFSSFFNDDPPCPRRHANIGCRTSYRHVIDQLIGQTIEWEAQNQVKGEQWLPTQPMVVPLLPPNNTDGSSHHLSKTDPADFTQQMRNFYLDHSKYAFQTMGRLLSESLTHEQTFQSMLWRRKFLERLKFTTCPIVTDPKTAQCYDKLFEDVIHDFPPALLAELLQEELASQKTQGSYQELATGGTLGCVSFTDSTDFQDGVLIYDGQDASQSLNFHQVALRADVHGLSRLELVGGPVSCQLNGPVRQISTGTYTRTVNVGVRSDHFCGVWMVGESKRPTALEVIHTQEPATCLVVSPHLSDELLVASESGAVCLWTVGKGLAKVREEDSNLYFNAKSAWRWCEFSSHPRIMVYADRTGADLTDFRAGVDHSYTLFRIGMVSESKSGERLILSRYLSEVHGHHHLMTTQYSAYVMDERMPSIPMLKWDHGMRSPPMFASVLPGTSPQRNHRVLLGSQDTQDIMMLQYSGGCATACVARGPHQKLLSPSEAVAHLPVRLPHRKQAVLDRLSTPAAGLAAMQTGQHMCVLQLSAAGDLFYQIAHLSSGLDTQEPSGAPVTSGSRLIMQRFRALASVNTSDDDEEDEDDDHRTRPRRQKADIEVVDYSQDLFDASDGEVEGGQGDGLSAPTTTTASSGLIKTTLQPHEEVVCKWKDWLTALDSNQAPKSPFTHHVIPVEDLAFKVAPGGRDPLVELAAQSVRQQLRKGSRGTAAASVLTHSATDLPPLRVTPAPGAEEPSRWNDDLSQRLAVSWQGKWKQWWQDHMGLNNELKRQELRRKRREEKGRRRRSAPSLSGSFASSLSCHSDSDLSGFSTCGSQDLGSDWEKELNDPPVTNDSEDGPPSQELNPTWESDICLGRPLFQSTQVNMKLIPAAQAKKSILVDRREEAGPSANSGTERETLSSTPHKRPRQTEQESLGSTPLKLSQRTGKDTPASTPQRPSWQTEQERLGSTPSTPSRQSGQKTPTTTPQRQPRRTEPETPLNLSQRTGPNTPTSAPQTPSRQTDHKSLGSTPLKPSQRAGHSTPTPTPQRQPRRTQEETLSSTPLKPSQQAPSTTPQRPPRRTEHEIMESLFSSQEPSQSLLGADEEQQSLPIMHHSSSSQPSSFSSQLSSFSSFFSSQRAPQVRPARSQTSQPKKKSRMGF
ncbi:TATA box-binding protein-associated factor RNA polymerase I subunit C [Engraulis encrasicolus]|uniref:TATA box-binding protein-associated factor RNA polymerase I subunit C n=1 Tax=Engraulis encrasicolus TaxID=184585 RepID=UPI002FD562AF